MDELSNSIYRTYTERFTELSVDKQFHFASRLAQWTGQPEAEALLQRVIEETKPQPEAVSGVLQDLLALRPGETAGINSFELRKPYFEQYPQLYGAHQALFRVRHWLFHYNIDARETFIELLPRDELDALDEELVADMGALGALSTYAVNYLYLYRRLIDADESEIFSTDQLRELSEAAKTPELAALFTYFVTHCIIGESLFYQRPVPGDKRTGYTDMLKHIEPHMTDSGLTLDMKLEYVVASRLVAGDTVMPSAIIRGILDEAAQNFDKEAGYITDTLRPDKNSLDGAEHRNVLFLLAALPGKLTEHNQD